MRQELVQVISAAIGAAVALFVVFLTHKATLARSLREKRLSKLEDLLGEVLRFSQQTQRLYDLALDIEASPESDEFDPELRKLRELRLETHSRIRLLSAIYFPPLEKVLDEMWQGVIHMDKQALRAGGGQKFSPIELRERFNATRSAISKMRKMCISEAYVLLGRKQSKNED